MPNLHGLLLGVIAVAALLGSLALFVVFPGERLLYRLLMLAGFCVMCGVWVLAILLSGMKRYQAITVLFGGAYALIVVASLLMRPWGLEGLLGGFVLGNFVLLAGMWVMVVRDFSPKGRLIAFDFAERKLLYPSLVLVGLLYNVAIWADKFMFWYFPPTSEPIIGGLRASLIYDLPVFLSYLSIIPGMAVFLVRIETDFVEYYDKFYDAVRSGGSLEYIESMRDEMVYAIQQGLGEIAKIQTLAVLVTFVAGPALLDALGISSLYLPLLHVQVVGGGPAGGVDGDSQRVLLSGPAPHRAGALRRNGGAQHRFHRADAAPGGRLLRIWLCGLDAGHTVHRHGAADAPAQPAGVRNLHAAVRQLCWGAFPQQRLYKSLWNAATRVV